MTDLLLDTSAVDRFADRLDDAGRRQMPFALAVALTSTMRDEAKPAAEARVQQVFDRPTPFTQRAFAVRPATKRSLEAHLFARPSQAEYLALQETGGTRRPPEGGKALPVPVQQRVNVYGNLPRRAIQRLLARPNVFSARIEFKTSRGGAVGGIWRRPRRGRRRDGTYGDLERLKLLISWQSLTKYRPRLEFDSTVEAAISGRLERHLMAALDRALATAR